MLTDNNSWMLERLHFKGVRHAVVLTADGLAAARADGTDPDTADRLAAACAGLASVGLSLADDFGAGRKAMRQVVVEFDGGFLFIRGAGNGSKLAVVTEPTVDPGLIAQQMQAQVQVIGERALSVPARHPAP